MSTDTLRADPSTAAEPTVEAIEFFVPRTPVVKGNKHKIRKNRKTGKRFVGRPEETKKAQAEVRLLASPHAPKVPWAKERWAIRMDVCFVFTPPPSWPEWKRLEALDGRYYPTEEHLGDRDNLHKMIADALEAVRGFGFYESDSQIVDGVVAKRYGAEAGYAVRLVPLPQSKRRRSYGYPGNEAVARERSKELVKAVLPSLEDADAA